MSKSIVIQSLLAKGLISPGTIVGVASSSAMRVYNRFIVSTASCNPVIQIEGVHVQNQQRQLLDYTHIVEVDGMELSRYLSHADLDQHGEKINRGKKRGRRPKNRA